MLTRTSSLAALVTLAVVSAAPLAQAAETAALPAAPAPYDVCDKANNSTTEYKSKDGYSKINARFCVRVTTGEDGTRTVEPYVSADVFYWWLGFWYTDNGKRWGYEDRSPSLQTKNMQIFDAAGTEVYSSGQKLAINSTGHLENHGPAQQLPAGAYKVQFTDTYKSGGYYDATGSETENDSWLVETGNHTVTLNLS
ncbi:hypothetical protein ABZ990_24550 [Streptomyces sp. NPDC046203]|uniref:hypothetical protein n=1 Tax=Streptomyces sp. NPDC046203 TaxID=3154602 RepID=UPI0033ED6910